MTISPEYVEQNRQLHEANKDYGTTSSQWGFYVFELVRTEGFKSVLDFGAGKGVLAGMLAELGVPGVVEYDPAIPGKDARPEPADLVVATDVLEHIEPNHLLEVMVELARLTKRKLFVDICTSPALKTLPDGRNAHLIVQPPDWWRYTLSRHFDVTHWVERSDISMVYGELVPKGMGEAERLAKESRPKRRKPSPEVSGMCGRLIGVSKASHDELARVRSVRMFEGAGDEPADMQIVWDTLDDVADPVPALEQILRLGRKGAIMRVALTEERTEDWWRSKVETNWHVIDWVADGKGLGIVVIPKCAVAGITVVGAVKTDDRWEQVEKSIERIKKRIKPAEPNNRRMILACYGPSLRDMIPRIKAEMEEAACDVVSVSGAHDFLLKEGIVPAYHVECDPRPHKADNIEKGHPDVRYLIASVVHPVLFDKLEGFDVSLWHVAEKEHAVDLFRLGEKGQHIISGGGSVGLRAMSLFYTMGYRDFSVYAMDCSFADDGKMWAGKHAGKQHEQAVVKVTVAGRQFTTSPVLASYATDFIEMIQKMDAQIRIYGDGMLPTMCRVHAAGSAKPGPDGLVDRMGFAFPGADKEWFNIIGSCNAALPVLLQMSNGRGVAVQAGGNVGVMPYLLSKHFGKVVTFEPDAENFACMQRNVSAPNVERRQAALGAEPGRAALTRKPDNCGGHYINGGGDAVAVETIDALNLDACDLIALDVEGMELLALLGACRTIERFRPTIMLEDNGLSERYDIAKGGAQQFLMNRFNYRVAASAGRDVILTP